MIEKFDSYEKASLFVEQKRSEGYHAEIVNESVGFLWGSRTVGGFRVLVSDEPGDFPETDEVRDAASMVVMRYFVLGILAVGILVALISLVTSLGTSMELAIGLSFVIVTSIGVGYLIFRGGFPSKRR